MSYRNDRKEAQRGPKRDRTVRAVVLLVVGVVVGILGLKVIGAIRAGDSSPSPSAGPPAESAAAASSGSATTPSPPREPEPCPRRTVGTTRLLDPVLVVDPGRGVGPVRIDRSTVQEVVDAFGDDCVLHRYDSGEVFQVSYLYGRDGEWQKDRETQRRVPNLVDIEQGVVVQMSFGAFQKDFRTTGGLTTDSTRADMVAELGEDYRHAERERLDSYDYRSKGIEFWVSRADDQINSFRIRAPR